jgi:hypothetical protein
MRTVTKWQANYYGKHQTNPRKMQGGLVKSRFRAQGIEAEMKV